MVDNMSGVTVEFIKVTLVVLFLHRIIILYLN